MADAPLLRRLNGRPQACDPCRARKVACDHGQPTCSRCEKRKESCVYTISEPRVKKQRLRSPSQAVTSTVTSTNTATSTHTISPSNTTAAAESTSTRSPSLAPGYLGFTSHNAVFEETRNSLSLVHGPALEIEPSPRRPPKTRACLIEMPSHLREMCLYVLRNLPGPRDDVMPNKLHCRVDDWMFMVIEDILHTLQQDWSEYLATREDAQLEEMALCISNNTSRPIRDEHSSAKAWTDQFTGSNIRWESIGLIWTYWNGAPGMEAAAVNRCLGSCVELVRHFTTANDILLYLCYRRTTIESLVTGDAGLTCWSYAAETVALLTFLGLHVGVEDPNYVPSLCSEHKRRITARVYALDKVLVSFTGRPPLLSHRYFSGPLAIDIDDQDLMGGDAAIKRAMSRLDDNGFRPDGELLGAALIRARVQIALIKGELLEMALASSVKATFERLAEIKTRCERTYERFPQNLIHRPDELDDPNCNVENVYVRILVRLEHLQNLFFAERLSLRLGHVDENRLLVISFEMVCLTLLFWTHQDRFAGVRRDFEWLLMAFAAPGGGILCLELLRPTFRGTHPDCPKLSRSAIIQKLSLLIGFLDWVRPPAPNADLCADCKAVLQGVLDHNLNAPIAGGGALDTLDWDIPTQLDFNFDLLDTFDWLRPEVLNMPA
ncbi:unnamed protein product [Fusarium graminearum]|uniref:Chromosome 1, complete genome n=1 Tax=Gibberella zeae (strain ATCC MYA-4620 / CBS 123657 / FGSC 9075 / NRRL 31084 / PH-1) TaxID=229533 RepID=A0A0E0RRM0_GIBZE|nr:hypothetical protein FG05_11996 [Fusarium graminearum]KAI6764556.1 hypothetical protein HG531_012443 [Fusarium graminearum]CAF3603582.1 unnamed protein product [Fusarium graminearum]CEF73895.1 unnamed protein product [Fusarium graminearum]CZS77161.1 unnamed protein product [Fusarium graminearum]